MKVTIEKVSFADKPVFSNLMQLYLYDSSEYDGWDITEHGFFRYGYIDHYWTEDGRYPFFIRVNGRLAGCAMIRTVFGPTRADNYYSMAEFFIMRKYRGQGVGKVTALKFLDMFQGNWHIGQTSGNKPAQAFWRKLIGNYTAGSFSESELPDEDFPWLKGPVQKFVARGRTLVYIVRHAQSTPSADEAGRPLTEKGLRDSKQVARALEYEQLDAVYSSPYRRAIQTVEPLDQEVQLVQDLRERSLAAGAVDFDEAALKTWKDFSYSYPGGESNGEAQVRGVKALEELVKANEGKRIAVGTHGTLMGLILNHFDPKEYNHAFCRGLDTPDIYLLVFDGSEYQWSTQIWKRRG